MVRQLTNELWIILQELLQYKPFRLQVQWNTSLNEHRFPQEKEIEDTIFAFPP